MENLRAAVIIGRLLASNQIYFGAVHHPALLVTVCTPVSVIIDLPPGAQFLAATPSPHVIDGGALTFDLNLDADIVVEVCYE